MAVQLSVAAIWGIGAGVFVAILTAIIVVWVQLRGKHKAPPDAVRRNPSQRRAHLSITDEDVLRMPGMRRLRPTPYNHPPGWAPISSRESVAKKALTPNPADVDPVTGVPPWPVRIPRRLKKTQSSPIARAPPAALSPITERSTNNTAPSPSLSNVLDLEPGANEIKAPANLDPTLPNVNSGHSELESSPAQLTPKPLFHGQQRSMSHGILTRPTFVTSSDSAPASSGDVELQTLQSARMPRSSSLCSQQPGKAPDIQLPPLPFELPPKNRKLQPRKSPSEMSPQRVSGMSLLSGDTSLLDESVSRAFSQAETEFTSISLTSAPGSQSTLTGLGVATGPHSNWNFSRIDRSASPISASKARNVGPQLSQQHSFRASLHNSLPRSASSGLSMSLLDRTSPNPKAALNLPKSTLEVPPQRRSKGQQPSATSALNVFQLNEDKRAKRASTSILQAVSGNQSSPIKSLWNDRPSSIATEDPVRWDPKTSMQPAKPSAMRNPAQRHKRQSCVRISNIPIIIPSSNPYRFSANLQPSISPLTSPLPSLSTNPRPPTLQTFNPHLPKDLRSPTQQTSPPKPSPENSPYSPTFSMIPLYAPPSPTTLSPTSSPDASPVSTPTRQPSTLRRPAQNLNRRRAIFPPSSVHNPNWPPLLSSRITPLDPPTIPSPSSPRFSFPDPLKTTQAPSNTGSAPAPSQPSTFLFQFPNPPGGPPPSSSSLPPKPAPPPPIPPTHLPPTTTHSSATTTTTNPHQPHPLGPRPLLSHPNRIRKPSNSTSPHRHRHLRSNSPKKADLLLRRSILELRRMNSEIRTPLPPSQDRQQKQQRDGKEETLPGHRRYLSLGDEEVEEEESEDDGEEDEEADGDGDGGGARKKKSLAITVEVTGSPLKVPLKTTTIPQTPTRDRGQKHGSVMSSHHLTPRSLYDGDGFLQDAGMAI